MNLRYTANASKAFADALARVQRAFLKQAALLQTNLQHPSLHAKKFDESGDVWQARVNRAWRFYFLIEADNYIITNIIPHPK
jgi:hypothetical protein